MKFFKPWSTFLVGAVAGYFLGGKVVKMIPIGKD